MVSPEAYTFTLHVCEMLPFVADSFERCRYSRRTLGECRIFSAAPGGQPSWFANVEPRNNNVRHGVRESRAARPNWSGAMYRNRLSRPPHYRMRH
jgi:hypothetical protein